MEANLGNAEPKGPDMFQILVKTIQLCAPQSPMDPYGDGNQLCHI